MWRVNSKNKYGQKDHIKSFKRKSDAINYIKDLNSTGEYYYLNKDTDYYSYERRLKK